MKEVSVDDQPPKSALPEPYKDEEGSIRAEDDDGMPPPRLFPPLSCNSPSADGDGAAAAAWPLSTP